MRACVSSHTSASSTLAPSMQPRDQPDSVSSSMSFGDHLHELRDRLFKALIVPLPLSIVLFFLAPYLRELLIAPLFVALKANGQATQIQALSPAETIMTDMKLAVVAALSLSAPWVVFQLWKFIEPGLHHHEKRYVHFITPLSSILTACAIAVFYWILLPTTLLFLVSFGASVPRKIAAPIDPAVATTPDNATAAVSNAPLTTFAFPVLDEDPVAPRAGEAWISTKDQVMRVAIPVSKANQSALLNLAADASAALMNNAPTNEEPQLVLLEVPLTVLGGISQVYRLSEYISFVLLLLAGAVVAFQMPAVILLLGWVGFVTPKFLREKRRWAVFIMAIIAAVVTPPDVMSMMLLLLPLWLLYEFGIVLLVFVPAHKVASGRVFSVGQRASAPAQTTQTAQSEAQSDPDEANELPRRDREADDGRGEG